MVWWQTLPTYIFCRHLYTILDGNVVLVLPVVHCAQAFITFVHSVARTDEALSHSTHVFKSNLRKRESRSFSIRESLKCLTLWNCKRVSFFFLKKRKLKAWLMHIALYWWCIIYLPWKVGWNAYFLVSKKCVYSFSEKFFHVCLRPSQGAEIIVHYSHSQADVSTKVGKEEVFSLRRVMVFC